MSRFEDVREPAAVAFGDMPGNIDELRLSEAMLGEKRIPADLARNIDGDTWWSYILSRSSELPAETSRSALSPQHDNAESAARPDDMASLAQPSGSGPGTPLPVEPAHFSAQVPEVTSDDGVGLPVSPSDPGAQAFEAANMACPEPECLAETAEGGQRFRRPFRVSVSGRSRRVAAALAGSMLATLFLSPISTGIRPGGTSLVASPALAALGAPPVATSPSADLKPLECASLPVTSSDASSRLAGVLANDAFPTRSASHDQLDRQPDAAPSIAAAGSAVSEAQPALQAPPVLVTQRPRKTGERQMASVADRPQYDEPSLDRPENLAPHVRQAAVEQLTHSQLAAPRGQIRSAADKSRGVAIDGTQRRAGNRPLVATAARLHSSDRRADNIGVLGFAIPRGEPAWAHDIFFGR